MYLLIIIIESYLHCQSICRIIFNGKILKTIVLREKSKLLYMLNSFFKNRLCAKTQQIFQWISLVWIFCMCMLNRFSCVWLFVTLTVAFQAPLSVGFSHGSGLPFPSPGDLPDPETEPGSPTLQVDFFTIWATGNMRSTVTAGGTSCLLPGCQHRAWHAVGAKTICRMNERLEDQALMSNTELLKCWLQPQSVRSSLHSHKLPGKPALSLSLESPMC